MLNIEVTFERELHKSQLFGRLDWKYIVYYHRNYCPLVKIVNLCRFAGRSSTATLEWSHLRFSVLSTLFEWIFVAIMAHRRRPEWRGDSIFLLLIFLEHRMLRKSWSNSHWSLRVANSCDDPPSYDLKWFRNCCNLSELNFFVATEAIFGFAASSDHKAKGLVSSAPSAFIFSRVTVLLFRIGLNSLSLDSLCQRFVTNDVQTSVIRTLFQNKTFFCGVNCSLCGQKCIRLHLYRSTRPVCGVAGPSFVRVGVFVREKRSVQRFSSSRGASPRSKRRTMESAGERRWWK